MRPVFVGDVLQGQFVDRPNQFLVRCRLDGRLIRAFMPNPGRMHELLFPGVTLYLEPAPASGIRRTRYTVLAVERDGKPIFLHTHLTNRVARFLIDHKRIPALETAEVIDSEVTVGRSRFDFLLRAGREQIHLEVKSCTLFGNGVAMFPDAVTDRGRKHLVELAAMRGPGARPVVLFVVHTPQVEWFMPDYHTDLAFSRTLLEVREQLQIVPISIDWRSDLSLDPEARQLDIPWDYLQREVGDRGAYLLILRLRRARRVAVGRLGSIRFDKGYYVYVGSAMANLSTRIARHVRRRKRMHWHIDYLRQAADEVVPLPIRSSQKLECRVASAFGSVLDPGPLGFGASDCACPTHLMWSDSDPLQQRAFHELLQQFRMARPGERSVESGLVHHMMS